MDFAHPEIALTINRVIVGSFFAISGYHKLFNSARGAALVETFKRDGVPFVAFNRWWVPAWEFVAGFGLVVGVWAQLFALPLLAICLVACRVDGRKTVESYKPIDWADRIDDWLYLPEGLYVVMLVMLLVGGPGSLSITG